MHSDYIMYYMELFKVENREGQFLIQYLRYKIKLGDIKKPCK
jgi:hypothetical protein